MYGSTMHSTRNTPSKEADNEQRVYTVPELTLVLFNMNIHHTP